MDRRMWLVPLVHSGDFCGRREDLWCDSTSDRMSSQKWHTVTAGERTDRQESVWIKHETLVKSYWILTEFVKLWLRHKCCYNGQIILLMEQLHLTDSKFLPCKGGPLQYLTFPPKTRDVCVFVRPTIAAIAHPVLLYMNSKLFLLRYNRPPTSDTNRAKAIVPE